MTKVLLMASVAILVAACSTEIGVRDLGPSVAATSTVNGLPFRVRERFVVELYQKTNSGYQLVHSQMETLANPEKIYVLEQTGRPFTNSDTKFKLNPDGTLQGLSVKTETKTDTALADLGTNLQTLGTQIKTLRDAAATRRTAEETKLVGEETKDVDYLDAYKAAVVAEAELGELPGDTKASVRLGKERDVNTLKVKANIAARKAGAPRPFPEASL